MSVFIQISLQKWLFIWVAIRFDLNQKLRLNSLLWPYHHLPLVPKCPISSQTSSKKATGKTFQVWFLAFDNGNKLNNRMLNPPFMTYRCGIFNRHTFYCTGIQFVRFYGNTNEHGWQDGKFLPLTRRKRGGRYSSQIPWRRWKISNWIEGEGGTEVG